MQQSLESSANNAAKGLSALQAVLQHDALLLDAEKQIRSRTIHKWLASPTAAGSAPGIGNPIPADVLVVDEASMVDIHLAVRLMPGGFTRSARHSFGRQAPTRCRGAWGCIRGDF